MLINCMQIQAVPKRDTTVSKRSSSTLTSYLVFNKSIKSPPALGAVHKSFRGHPGTTLKSCCRPG